MSKYVKNLIADDLRKRLTGVEDALLVNVVGLDANANNRLRSELRQKSICLLAVKNSLARRATEGTPLAPLFEELAGASAVCWGAGDIVSLTKEVTRLAKDDSLAPFEARGGVMDGEKLSAEQVQEVSKWPSRQDLLGIVAGQLTGVASQVASQLVGPATEIASQIEKLIDQKGGDGDKPDAQQEENDNP